MTVHVDIAKPSEVHGDPLGRGPRRLRAKRLLPYVLVAPTVLIVSAILLYPMVFNIILGFWDWRFTDVGSARFVGLDNYRRLFLSSQEFWTSLRFTLIFLVGTLTIEMFAGTGIALLIRPLGRLRSLIAGILLLPFMVADLAAGLVWRLLFVAHVSPINYALEWLGLPAVQWLSNPTAAVWSVMIAEVWRSAPFVMLIMLMALAGIPTHLYDAAKVDGASSLRSFWHITLPLLRPAITIVIVFQAIFKLRLFDLAFILTGGGPGNVTLPLGILLQRLYFRYQLGGDAAALGVILSLMGALIAILTFKLVYREVEYS